MLVTHRDAGLHEKNHSLGIKEQLHLDTFEAEVRSSPNKKEWDWYSSVWPSGVLLCKSTKHKMKVKPVFLFLWASTILDF